MRFVLVERMCRLWLFRDDAGFHVRSSIILFTSLPAAMQEGNSFESRTVMCLYPRVARRYAIANPHVPAPTIRIFESCVRGAITLLR
jgi:hypothetical protein